MDIVHNFIYRIVAFAIRLILRMNGGITIKGKENVPKNGGAIVAANHISYLDPPLIGSVLPRNATFMARKGLFQIPVLRWMIKRAAFPVNRERTLPSTIKETVKRLKKGQLVVIFPEGRRSETGELLEAKRGIGMIASLSNAPVVPTLIVGSDKVLPVNARWLKRARITVIFGRPIYYTCGEREKGDDTHRLQEEISNTVMTAIRGLKKQYGN